ncbi:CDGSH iron-sulfur domain-containing protein [Microbacterium sp. HD4P20]|uniref:CDGSH iron-sulfur domain-containing protein n=1 Tax=Microbacterium sp. HD4P20 TaxID=2864874 RepID=UPI001C6418F1|nr:CDGSH iron-sulfur domain-containing protein [Microbacterium sp. HD4P20]MCP2636240.1 CDGSH iron-sulfur domain-containing protein [Microbacterium sp. HD4P20]
MTEQEPRVTITPYPDGPFIVRGSAQLIDDRGRPIERHRRTVALCRCGASAIKPWCDGTHKLSGFRTDR